jgi:hypothetical protein
MAQSRFLAFEKKEFLEILPPTVFFAVGFNLIVLTGSFNPFPLRICCIHLSTLDSRVLDCWAQKVLEVAATVASSMFGGLHGIFE